MVIPLSCALSSFSSTWSSCPSFYVHSFMILLIISCTKSCSLVAISLCHLLLHHVYCLCLIQTTWHNGISNLVSLITKTKFGLSATWLPRLVGHVGLPSRGHDLPLQRARMCCVRGSAQRPGYFFFLFSKKYVYIRYELLGSQGMPFHTRHTL
jgi:hypothetical protein